MLDCKRLSQFVIVFLSCFIATTHAFADDFTFYCDWGGAGLMAGECSGSNAVCSGFIVVPGAFEGGEADILEDIGFGRSDIYDLSSMFGGCSFES